MERYLLSVKVAVIYKISVVLYDVGQKYKGGKKKPQTQGEFIIIPP